MNKTAQRRANTYKSVGIETGVLTASPHQLIAMLFDGALQAVAAASLQMKAGNISGKGESISRAINIIDSGLRASLDKKLGGEIAENLDALYDYLCRRLLLANMKNNPEMLEEAHRLLSGLKSGWDHIGTLQAAVKETSAAVINFKV
ncbi:flagellar export chaperone FliS [Methylosarcina fibrata]|uniref:flagellar export chaperone FliS n=1 Tax=Methylosarcina fibrata TaxID=105972 RepID=UPI000360B533|nr:flagellar export chaperone FliS [Methylosarcina fibrata]